MIKLTIMQPSLEKLRKFFRLEHENKYENTAIIGSLNNEWLVMGEAKAHLFTNKDGKSYAAGEKFTLGI